MAKKPQLRKQTHAYWQKRSVERTLAAERQALPYIRKARQVYAKSAREITKQVQDIYAKYYRDNGFDVQALRELAPQGDVRRLKARMRKLGLETKLPDNYAYRVNRLEMLNIQMRAEVYDAGRQIKALTGKILSNAYQTSYYRTIYDTAKGIGHTPAFSQLNSAAIGKVLDSKNYGKNFSERIWGRSEKLGDELQKIVGSAITTGQSPEKTARLIRERFDVSANSAERLIRTETNYFENQAEMDSYKEMGIEEYQFLATIDTKTSEVCQEHDHKTYKVIEAKVGVNMPPLHPNCRSTITPYFGKEWQPEVRIARNPITGRNEYITNMSYKEWSRYLENDWMLSSGEKIKVNTEPKTKTIGSADVNKIKDYLKGESGIEFRKVNKLSDKLTDEQIIAKVAGGDRTLGSCASVAFAYVGNKLGYDVKDFRGGKSQKFFSVNAKFIIGKIATTQEGLDGHKTGYALLKTMKPNKEYYFGIGKHAAIVRLNGELKKWQYLELQSPEDNGWRPFTKSTLKKRFSCPKSQTKSGLKMPVRGSIAEVDAFRQIEGFSDIIGYINTASEKQLKGKTGRIM